MKQIIVTGGRHYEDRLMTHKVLSLINPDFVVQGGAPGADSLALIWAKVNKKEHDTIKADWNKYGNAAGPFRNRAMLEKYPNATVVAFPGNNGMANCIKQALELNITVIRVVQ